MMKMMQTTTFVNLLLRIYNNRCSHANKYLLTTVFVCELNETNAKCNSDGASLSPKSNSSSKSLSSYLYTLSEN